MLCDCRDLGMNAMRPLRSDQIIHRLELKLDTQRHFVQVASWEVEKLQKKIDAFEDLPLWKRLLVAIRGTLD